jgi:integrase/recombinase XerD
MKLLKAVEGWYLFLRAGNYSTITAANYRSSITRIARELNDPDINMIDKNTILDYLSRRKDQVSSSSLASDWKVIRSFYNWACPEFDVPNPAAEIPMPRHTTRVVQPFSPEEIHALLKACAYSVLAATENRRRFSMRRPTARRDQAIVLVLLDTGIRVSELCRLNVRDVDLETGEIEIIPYQTGVKSKPRTVYIGQASRRALWSYLNSRGVVYPENPLFVGINLLSMNRTSVRHLLERLGSRAGVFNCHPHRFRHTFAIQYLRNGGDVFTLQRLLGHSSLSMVRHYLALADADVADAHRRASPVDRMRL